MEKLNNRLLSFRNQKELSQEQLAEALNVSRQTINSIENRRYEPSCMLALKIANYFGVEVDKIFWIEK